MKNPWALIFPRVELIGYFFDITVGKAIALSESSTSPPTAKND